MNCNFGHLELKGKGAPLFDIRANIAGSGTIGCPAKVLGVTLLCKAALEAQLQQPQAFREKHSS